jgi:hypothetical protein
VEHLGNDLGIDDKSSSSNSSNNSSDVESSSSDFMSQTSEECLVQMPKHDRFKKRSYQSTTLDSFVVKQPETSSTTSPSTSKLIDQDSSTRVIKVWTDPIKAKDKERWRVAEQRRRESKKSDTSIRTKRVLGNVIDLQAARNGADMTQSEARASVIDEVIARLKPPKKSKSKQSSDTSGHLRSEKSATAEKLYHGEISGTGKRLYTADETLFLFEEFCKHHYKDPQKKDDQRWWINSACPTHLSG